MVQWNAAEYKKNSSNQKRWADGLLKIIRFRGDESVLDVGCGDGKISLIISRKVPGGGVIGIDRSSAMIACARKSYGSKRKNLRFMRKNACRLPYQKRFDLVFSNSCFHWIPDHRGLLASLYRALKPEGEMYIRMGAKGNVEEILQITQTLMKNRRWKKYFKRFKSPFYFPEQTEYRRLIQRQGFEIIKLRTFKDEMRYRHAAAFKNSLRPIWSAYLEKIPRLLREDFLSEIVADFLKTQPQKRGVIRVKMNRLEIVVRRPKN